MHDGVRQHHGSRKNQQNSSAPASPRVDRRYKWDGEHRPQEEVPTGVEFAQGSSYEAGFATDRLVILDLPSRVEVPQPFMTVKRLGTERLEDEIGRYRVGRPIDGVRQSGGASENSPVVIRHERAHYGQHAAEGRQDGPQAQLPDTPQCHQTYPY